jgi:putative transposase
MPRPFRIYVEGLSVHVMHRGINRMPIFDEEDDYRVFLRIVRYGARLEGVDVHAFALMTNHYHLQVTPRHAVALPRAMKRVNNDYSRYYNKKHRRTGTIWNHRPRRVLIEDECQWLTCLRYIEQNPVRAGLVSQPQEYPWTSYRVHALGEPTSWLALHPVYLSLGASPCARQAAYAAMCSTPLSESESTVQRCPLPDRRKPPPEPISLGASLPERLELRG